MLSSASLFVNASAKEGWGINNIEANLCGTVALASSVAGQRDSVVHNVTGMLYEPDNRNDFCDKAAQLLNDPEKRWRMELAARERAMKFDWDTVTMRMLKLLS
jgi:glycosyltransferase involved in cell wall biosynthesis